ncbi:Pectic acid lyase [anaerobic digester metagenome]
MRYKYFISYFIIFIVIPSLAVANNMTWSNFSYEKDFYSSQEAIIIADRIVQTQRCSGGWGKIISPDKHVSLAVLIRDQFDANLYDQRNFYKFSHRSSTIDNNATHSHIRFLLRSAKVTRNKKYSLAALLGIKYLLSAQYPTGGWPQNFPNTSSYGGYVTFNDGAMVGVMIALREASSGEYDFIDASVRHDADQAFWRGIDFILKSQIIVDGEKTAWCAQHDPVNYAPVGGRTYELPSISGSESVGIVKLLMGISDPTLQVKDSIKSAVAWFEKTKIIGFDYLKIYDSKFNQSIILEYKEDPQSNSKKVRSFQGRGYDNILVPSKSAKPLWARFYDLENQRPFFVGWDGLKKYDVSKIDIERRTGYKWYGRWPESLLQSDWPKWKIKYFE